MAKEWYGDRGRNIFNVCHAWRDDYRQWRDLQRGCQQFQGQRYERPSNTDGECSNGCADDFNAAYESDSDGGPDCDILRRCHRHCASDVSMEEEWSEYFGRNGFDLRDACDNDRR